MARKRVLVVGGGMSGLIAARGLAQSECDVTLMEAKDRLGGRILTRHGDGEVVELGAEFVHGRADVMMRVLGEAGLELADASEKNRLVKSGRMKKADLWERVGKVIGKIDARGKDLAFEEWLEQSGLDAESKEMALAFVEGFDAADARVIGAHGLLRAEYSSEHSEGEKQARVREGYGALIEYLRAAAVRSGVRTELGARVRLVKWRRGRVEVKTEDGRTFEGDAAVVTLPLGVLKLGRVVFEPALVHKREAIQEMRFGNVAKLNFIFRRRWWTEQDEGGKKLETDFGFMHAFKEAIPTWWSNSRGPVLVGWAAGPKGEAMLDLSAHELRKKGIETIARVFSRRVEVIDEELAAFEFYDWRADVDIGGAYSYLPVNGLDLPKELAAPVEGTLFFAGEATAMDAQMGTVSGAIESGFRVVKEIGEEFR
jgi:monoamine oxidase